MLGHGMTSPIGEGYGSQSSHVSIPQSQSSMSPFSRSKCCMSTVGGGVR